MRYIQEVFDNVVIWSFSCALIIWKDKMGSLLIGLSNLFRACL